MRAITVVLCLAVSLGFVPIEVLADDCAKVIAEAQTKIKIKKAKSHSENIFEFACSREFEQMVSSGSSGFSIKLPIGPGEVVEFGGNQNNASSMRRLKTYCQQRNYRLTDDEASFVYQQMLPPAEKLKALADLGACRNLGGSLVDVHLRPTDRNTVTIFAKFNRPPLGDNVKVPNPILYELRTTGLTCSPRQLVSLANIPQAGLSDVCTWQQGQDASVALLHNSGAPATDTLKWDVDGELAGTVTLRTQLEKKGEWKLEADLHQKRPIAYHAPLPMADLLGGTLYWYEDAFVFRVPDGKITNVTARCVELCFPGGAVNPPWNPDPNKHDPGEVFWITPTPEGVESPRSGSRLQTVST